MSPLSTPRSVSASTESFSEPSAAKPDNRRGRLRIFFGYAAGVGKTFSMLRAAGKLAADGRDVVVGCVHLNGDAELEVLLDGLRLLTKGSDPGSSGAPSELLLEEALRRRPEILLVDELQHINSLARRHRRRYQEVNELLAAGVDVFTTLDVENLESLSDIIAGITGTAPRETVPDILFDEAEAIDLVDLPVEELLERLRNERHRTDGTTRTPSLPRQENLLALREIALRRAAERINRDARLFDRIERRQMVDERPVQLLVCVSPSETSATLIRRTRAMAAASGAAWIACYVNTGADFRRRGDRDHLSRNLELAERLGGEVQTLFGGNRGRAILDFAEQRSVSRIIVGKNRDTFFRRIMRRGLVEQLIRESGDIDIYVIRGIEEEPFDAKGSGRSKRRISAANLVLTLAALAGATGIAELFGRAGFSDPNIIMAYVLEIFVVALFLGWGPSVIASVGSVLAFNLFFTAPYFTLAVNNAGYLVTFAVMLAVSLVTSSLVQRVRRQAELAHRRGQRSEALYRLSRSLTGEGGAMSVRLAAQRHLSSLLRMRVTVVRRAEELGGDSRAAAAQWVMDHGKAAGRGTANFPDLDAVLLPLPGSESTLGVLSFPGDASDESLSGDQRQLLEATTALIAVAIEREELAEKARRVILEAEQERSRNAVLRAISHDLRTPLATISGAAETLRRGNLDPITATDLMGSIGREADWLGRLLENLLQLGRLDSSGAGLSLSRETIDDIVSGAVSRLDHDAIDGRLTISLPDELFTIEVDPTLIVQLLVNLVENAVKYSEPGTPVELEVTSTVSSVEIVVRDRGWGFAEEELPHLFERFYRGRNAAGVRGTGLGLAICQAIVRVHGGAIRAARREGGGSSVTVVIPRGRPRR